MLSKKNIGSFWCREAQSSPSGSIAVDDDQEDELQTVSPDFITTSVTGSETEPTTDVEASTTQKPGEDPRTEREDPSSTTEDPSATTTVVSKESAAETTSQVTTGFSVGDDATDASVTPEATTTTVSEPDVSDVTTVTIEDPRERSTTVSTPLMDGSSEEQDDTQVTEKEESIFTTSATEASTPTSSPVSDEDAETTTAEVETDRPEAMSTTQKRPQQAVTSTTEVTTVLIEEKTELTTVGKRVEATPVTVQGTTEAVTQVLTTKGEGTTSALAGAEADSEVTTLAVDREIFQEDIEGTVNQCSLFYLFSFYILKTG